MFFIQLFIGCFIILGTVIIHAIALDRLLLAIEHNGPFVYKHFRRLWKIPMIVLATLGVYLTLIFEIWLWAFFYLSVGAMHGLEEALYFSTVAFTTVGFGDIVLSHEWRLMSAFQAANGFILFGWSTAFIFEIMTKLYKQDEIRKTD